MANLIPPLSDYAAGRDLIFEIHQNAAKELALRWARNRGDYACLNDNNQMVATWPSDVDFQNNAAGDAGAEFALQASNAKTIKKSNDLGFLKNEMEDSYKELPILNMPTTWPAETGFNLTANGNIATGITLN
ncbi:MAG: hypothetical protein HKN85_02495, partial [Gammaproteobacteria bacterium]|nr:hypothetical protein [Gammaproteobacteria bacterium]